MALCVRFYILFRNKEASLIENHSLIEIQSFLSTLVGKFEFAMTDKAERILRQPMLVMAPMVDDELERGIQMPLAVSVAPQDGEI
jgi:hypothetical protein